MSAVGEAAAALTSACTQADATGAALLDVHRRIEHARALLVAAVEGSAQPAALSAVAGTDMALEALTDAATLLASATTALRTYVADVLVVSTGGPSPIVGPAATGAAPTRPSRPPHPAAQPDGRRTPADNSEPDTARSLRRENEAAAVLARHGFHVVQNPPPKANGKRPDYLVEGRYFDCYAPRTVRARNIAAGMSLKAGKEQSDRIVLYLGDSDVDRAALERQLREWPPAGVREIIAVDNDEAWHLLPRRSERRVGGLES